jgi:hypothetical protein
MTNFTQAIIRLSNKDNYADVYDLEFDLIPSSFLSKWIDRYLEAKHRQDTITEPWAFYNLNDNWSPEYTVNFLNYHIDQCNLLSPNMFDRKLTNINDQDTLNQIHSVFELHHGKLDEWKNNELLKNNPKLREHLSHVNQTVHRCESADTSKGRIRIVYFDLPKTKQFTESDYQLFTNSVDFGGLYTVYADVGKPIESLAQDNDDHHHDFVPNLHYSVDCSVKFYNDDGVAKDQLCKKYLDANWDYFANKGYTEDDPRLTTGSIKIGQLRYVNKQQILDRLKNYNYIQDLILY